MSVTSNRHYVTRFLDDDYQRSVSVGEDLGGFEHNPMVQLTVDGVRVHLSLRLIDEIQDFVSELVAARRKTGLT